MTRNLKEGLLADWEWTRSLTLKYIESVPDDKLSFSPGHGFGTLGRQLRHMADVQECYLKGLETGEIDFKKKRKDYMMETSKAKLLAYVKELDEKLKSLMKNLEEEDLNKPVKWQVWENLPDPTIFQAITYMTQHEIFHQGILQLYAALAGFQTVRFF